MLTELIYYDLKVAALIAVFYLFYMLLLARETTHTLNRIVLLSGIVLSAILPLCIITLHRTVVIENGLQPMMEAAAADDATPLPITEALVHSFDWTIPIAVVLLTGTLIRLLYLSQGYSKLNRLIRGGERHILPSGTNVCVVDAPFAPFSWMQTIVLSRVDWKTDSSPILAHEEAHVRHRHSYDVVVVEMLTTLQWFNPVVWFLRQELRILHEYEADASVLSSGFDESQYIHLLMQKATGIQACALANGIHTPKTKKRILMMLKTKSSRTAWLKALYVVPIVLASMAMTARTVIEYKTVTPEDKLAVRVFYEKNNGRGESYQIRHTPDVKFYNNGKEETIPDNRSVSLEVSKTTMLLDGVKFDVSSLPDLPVSTLREIHLDQTGPDRFVCNLVTGQPKPSTRQMNDMEFVAYVKQHKAAGVTNSELTQMMLNEGGGISRARILHLNGVYGHEKGNLLIIDGKEVSRDVFDELQPEAIASVTVMDVGPAKKTFGEKGRYGATIIKTKAKEAPASSPAAEQTATSAMTEAFSSADGEADEGVFDIVEQMPIFPGGDGALMGFIARNVKYPAAATEWGVQGRVIVKFVVEKDGSLSNVRVVRTTGIDEPSDITVTARRKEMTTQERKEAEARDEGLKAGRQALIDEAIRVVNAMPRWTPGKQNGQIVRCWFTLPVTYRLN